MSSRPSAPVDFAERRVSKEAVIASAIDRDRVVLRDGSSVVIRPLAAGDEATIDEWFAGLGPETRYARFLTSLKLLDPRTRSRLASVDHRDHEAITAVALDGTIVGIARYMRAPRSVTAEVAVAVVDHWTGRGLATLLLERIAARARAAGILSLSAWCLASNGAIIRLLRRIGPTTIDPPAAGVVKVRIDLTSAGRDPG
jgi:RimJ/RimL family protein N-acetyltransferase